MFDCHYLGKTYGTKYSRMNQVKFVVEALKIMKWYGLPQQTTSLQILKAFFHKFYLVYSWILCPIWSRNKCNLVSHGIDDFLCYCWQTLREKNKKRFYLEKYKEVSLFFSAEGCLFNLSFFNLWAFRKSG